MHDHGPAGHEHEHGHGTIPAGALIGACGLSLRRGGRIILDHVDIDVSPGEIVTLIGPNGAGKSTLVRALLGLEPPDAGLVTRKPGLRMGYVPQRFAVDRALPMTVARFLSLGGKLGRRPAADALAEVGAAHVGARQLAEISGGELQRVALARALLGEPELLVLDEPVASVDFAGEAELYTLIAALRDKRRLGILLVSHDLHVVTAASDRVLCLNRHVCCTGVPEAVAQHPEYTRLFGPETSRAFAVYQHHHDHRHGIGGEVEGPGETP